MHILRPPVHSHRVDGFFCSQCVPVCVVKNKNALKQSITRQHKARLLKRQKRWTYFLTRKPWDHVSITNANAPITRKLLWSLPRSDKLIIHRRNQEVPHKGGACKSFLFPLAPLPCFIFLIVPLVFVLFLKCWTFFSSPIDSECFVPVLCIKEQNLFRRK